MYGSMAAQPGPNGERQAEIWTASGAHRTACDEADRTQVRLAAPCVTGARQSDSGIGGRPGAAGGVSGARLAERTGRRKGLG